MNRTHHSGEKGSFLLIAMLTVLILSLISLFYWQMLSMLAKQKTLKNDSVQAYFAARSGIEAALDEIKNGNAWTQNSTQLSSQWHFVSVSGNATTFYKSTSGSNPLTHFSLPVTFSVTVSGDPSIETVNITSISQVGSNNISPSTKTLSMKIIRSPSGEINIISTEEK